MQYTDALIEAAARAMFPTCFDEARSKWQVRQLERRRTARNKARVAIIAILDKLREPSEGMMYACDDFDIYWNTGAPGDKIDVWRAMVHNLREEFKNER